MAVTKTHPIKSTLKAAIDYICNPEKTDVKLLVSAYGCAAETADIEFAWTRQLHADLMGLLRRDLPRLKGLDQVTAQVRSLVDGMAAGPGKFDIRSFGGTAIGGYKQLSVRLFRVADIVNGRFQR